MKRNLTRTDLPVNTAFRCTNMDTKGKVCERRQEVEMRRRDGTKKGLCLPCAKQESALRADHPGRFEEVRFSAIRPKDQLSAW